MFSKYGLIILLTAERLFHYWVHEYNFQVNMITFTLPFATHNILNIV